MRRSDVRSIGAAALGAAALVGWGDGAAGQSSSLYVSDGQRQAITYTNTPTGGVSGPAAGGMGPVAAGREAGPLYVAPRQVNGRMVHPELAAMSYTSIAPQEPRRFTVHDLVTIIIREQSTAKSESTLDTEKDYKLKGGIEAFPHLNLGDLLTFQKLVASRRGEDEPFPEVDASGSSEFEGEGEYERKDTLTTRLTARVLDVKPNGTLTLEARTFIKNDDEELTISVTGMVRAEDIGADNSVLSTQVYDLRVTKEHEGEMRKASKKGLLTKVFDTIFNF